MAPAMLARGSSCAANLMNNGRPHMRLAALRRSA
jgi:hypothetical protein